MIAEGLESGKLSLVIVRRFPMAELRDADPISPHAKSKKKRTGLQQVQTKSPLFRVFTFPKLQHTAPIYRGSDREVPVAAGIDRHARPARHRCAGLGFTSFPRRRESLPRG